MKNTWKVALATFALLGTVQAANADLNINGETGLILNPTAQIPQKGQVRLQANYYDAGSLWGDKNYGVFGAISPADKLEVSGGISKYRSDDPDWNRSSFAIGAKYQLMSQADKGLDVAIGAGYNGALARNIHAYVAATRSFGVPGRTIVTGTIGARWDRFDDKVGSKSSKGSLFAGVEVPVTLGGDVSVIGEVQSKNIGSGFSLSDSKIPYSLGLRYKPSGQSLSVTAGLQRHGLNSPWENKSKLFAQVGYNFGG